MSTLFLILGVVLAGMIIASVTQLRSPTMRIAGFAAAAIVLVAGFALASFRYVAEDKIGVVNKNIGFTSLPPGQIIATNGEKGPQAAILPPGWQAGYWPFIYDIEFTEVVEIEPGTVGMITAADGQPLPRGATYAPPWKEGSEREMLDAVNFLGEGGGYKGPQTTVLTPGKYRFNPKLFKFEPGPVLTIEKAEVGVVKSNVGDEPPATAEQGPEREKLVDQGQRGIWRTPLNPNQYYAYSHSNAYQVTKISTRQQIVHYTAIQAQRAGGGTEESAIVVRTSDGFTFPVDVRVKYEILPRDAPLLVASVGDDKEGLRDVMNSEVRAIFRNNAQGVKALDYVKQRKQQEEQSLEMLQNKLNEIGVTVSAVLIGDVGDEESLGTLLKTQKDREIAFEEQETFKVQQLAAEQQKQLSKTEQEAEEEKRLATASYQVKIAEQEKEKKIIEANAEAESVQIKAEAQADAYRLIAEQIGSGNAALVELLKIVGERNISITPRVMVVGNNGAGTQDGETTALIGTMLDTMTQKSPPAK